MMLTPEVMNELNYNVNKDMRLAKEIKDGISDQLNYKRSFATQKMRHLIRCK